MTQAAVAVSQDRGYLLIPTNRIRRYPHQPRSQINPEYLAQLKASIAVIGQRRPIIVKPVVGDPRCDFELIDGECRWLCCKELRKPKMKAIIEEPEDEDEQFMSSVVANIPSHPHSPLEIARAIKRIRESKGMRNVPDTEQMTRIGAMFGHDFTWAYRYLRLLELDPKVQAFMEGSRSEDDRLNTSVATFLLGFSREIQVKLAFQAVAEELSRRQVELLAARMTAETGEERTGVRRRKPADDYRNLLSFLRRLREGAELVLAMPMTTFEAMFLKRDPQAREQMLEEVRTCKGDLAEIEQVLERIAKERVSAKKR